MDLGDKMKTINVTFEDEEYQQLLDTKNKLNQTWRVFICSLLHTSSDDKP